MADSSSALDVSAKTEELNYLYASNVNFSIFVSEKLSARNYHVWKVQMVCLMESQKMGGIVDDTFNGPGATRADTIKRYDNLLKGWIFGSLSEDVLRTVIDLESARAVWEKLKSTYDSRKRSTQDMELYDKRTQESRYQCASNINVSNFVSEKLSLSGNYHVWKAQMVCLMESQKMGGIVDDAYDNTGATQFTIVKQYENLLKGWIFGSLAQDLLTIVVGLDSVREVWRKLKLIFDHEKSIPQGSASLALREPQDSASKNQIEIKTDTEIENKERNFQLLNATVEGRWWEAESILKNDKQAAMEAITNDGSTMLHLAVGTGQNDFVQELLNFIDDGKEIEKKNSDGRTALHIAAIVGNTAAVQLLVNKRKELLGMADHKLCVPLLSAYQNVKLDTFVNLLKATGIKQHTPSGFYYGDLGSAASVLVTLIFTKQYDLAISWISESPELVTIDDQVLMAIAKNFPSDLGFSEALIYPCLNNVSRKLVKRCFFLFHSYKYLYAIARDILWAKKKSKPTYYSWLFPEIVIILLVPAAMLYPIYQLICLFILVLFYPLLVLYFLMWKILAIIGGPIKRIDKKKRDCIKAKKILNLVCDNIDKLSSGSANRCYSRPILEAACQGAHEVVNEILLRSPKAIDSLSKNGHNIIQLAVINRSEKVYNCICNFVERKDLSIKDSSNNNILHLAGRLAPSFVLSRTAGAALQLQRELQWSKEVEKFMSPTELVEKNINVETPEMVFTREHKVLMKEGENWMKTTAESCSITAALITTIVFAAAITVPGGNDQQTGIPLFRNDIGFTIFAVSDAISLFSSSTALLVFLSILTARFSEQDFLVSLPRRLIIGLCTLFLSTIAMIVAFSAVLFLVFCDERAWMLAPIGGLACFPIAVIVTLQFPLVVDLIRSTYRPIFLADCSKSNMNNMRSSFAKQRSEDAIQFQLLCSTGFKKPTSISIKHINVHQRSSLPVAV
ncbi:hypothetical protein L6452_26754 [Arctium lappa]|uniref:Uncharacterized protein n=1 Tax=Arctium lappa TaxID=4217 RepID=A0ACB8ZU86_ARCLA|nr:hypothetical protein L6452_26754 [Arctium lappa]